MCRKKRNKHCRNNRLCITLRYRRYRKIFENGWCLSELEDGGIIYKDKVCILLGSEVETSEKGRNGKCGAAHNVCFFPHLKDIKGFSNEMSKHIKNITLSTQRSDISGYDLIDIVEKYNGILIPAHIFTPFKYENLSTKT